MDILKRFKKDNRLINDIKEPYKSKIKAVTKILEIKYENKLKELGIEDIPTAYRKNISVKDNANIHKNNKVWLCLDFKKYFDSISYKDIEKHLEDIKLKEKFYYIDPKTNGLIQGSPASGVLAGLACLNFWCYMKEDLNKLPNKIVMTQYCDDICISSQSNINKKEIIDMINKNVRKANLNLTLKSKKTRLLKNNNRRITGVSVNHLNQLTPGKNKVKELKYELSLIKSGKLKKNMKFYQILYGRYNFYNYIDESGRLDKINKEYKKELELLKTRVLFFK